MKLTRRSFLLGTAAAAISVALPMSETLSRVHVEAPNTITWADIDAFIVRRVAENRRRFAESLVLARSGDRAALVRVGEDARRFLAASVALHLGA